MWSVMEPLMPTVTGRSRPWTDQTRCRRDGVEVPHGAPWRDVPEQFGKCNSIYWRLGLLGDWLTPFLMQPEPRPVS